MRGKKPQDMDVAPGQILSCKSFNGFPVRYDIFFHDDKLLAGRAEKVTFVETVMSGCSSSDGSNGYVRTEHDVEPKSLPRKG